MLLKVKQGGLTIPTQLAELTTAGPEPTALHVEKRQSAGGKMEVPAGLLPCQRCSAQGAGTKASLC